MTFAAALALATSRSTDPDALAELASEAIEEGEETQALALIAPAAARHRNARLWQWKGLLERAIDDHAAALASFAEAALLDPADASIAHGRARVALEAGVESEHYYQNALRLAPGNRELLAGLSAALFAAGRGDQSEDLLDKAVASEPMWIEGHLLLAQLRSMLGRGDQATASLERALAAMPDRLELWQALLDLDVRREDFAALDKSVERARRALGTGAPLLAYEAIAASELGEASEADRLFEQAAIPVWHIRHLLRTGRAARALPLIDAELASPRAAEAWPYAAIAWRLTGDPRSDWLEGDPRLVSVIDLGPDLPPLEELAQLLRSLHLATGGYLDQSVRGGTQTDGPLLSRVDPLIRKLRSAIVGAVERHVAQLPPPDPAHPLLARRRDRRIRFAGSWSVRLRSGGRHSNHVHPLGWISSALYIALPQRSDGERDDAGWLTLGEPDDRLGLELAPRKKVEPSPGRLVLFPSWMWHGTIPFSEGERLTVAFDVAVPR